MKPKQKSVLLWLVIIVLVIITTPWFGGTYEKILGRELSPGFWGPSNPEYIDGFIMSLFFFTAFLLTLSKKQFKQILVVIVVLSLIDVILGGWWQGLVIDLGLAIVAWLLAQGVLLAKKQIH